MHMSAEDTVDAIHDQGGLAIVAHPFMPTYFASMTQRRLDTLLESRTVDGIELRHTAPVLPGTWKRLDEYYAAHRDRLGAAVGAGDSHFGAADIGRIVTVFEGSGAAGLARLARGAHHLAARPGSGPPRRGCARASPSSSAR